MVPDTRDYKNNNQQSNAIESTLEINTPLYVGGVDTALIDNTFPLDSTLGFNGCVRKVELSTDVPDIPINFDLSTPTSSANVDACLLNKVIDGASMEGFGYIQQENNFAVGDMIEVNMVFRTTINNALLLAIADDLGYFFTIDISDGKVRAVVSHGTGSSPYIVRTTSVQSEYTICNDEEHQVIVSMSQTGLQITLDSYLPDSTPFDTGTNFIYTNSPVFVGGMPDYAATLVLDGINTKSLRGCIQTLVINGDVKDLREPEYSQGVSNGCPLPL
ncbi:laminin subunit alpha-2-like [Saccoglossus kowalevskii]